MTAAPPLIDIIPGWELQDPEVAGRLDADLLGRAYRFSEKAHVGQTRLNGDPYVSHCVEVARVLAELQLDSVTVACGLLHDIVEDTDVTVEDVRREFGPEVAQIVDGLTKIANLPLSSREERQVENYRKLLLSVLTLPLSFPGVIVGFFVILLGGRQGAIASLADSLGLGRWTFAYGLLGLFLAYLYFSLPRAIASYAAAAESMDHALEEAARSLGASFWQRFIGVLVPAVAPSIVAGCLMVFTLSVGEFNLTWMLHTPLTRTLPVGLADSYASMRIEIGSAYTLVFLLLIVPVLWAMQAVAHWIESRQGSLERVT